MTTSAVTEFKQSYVASKALFSFMGATFHLHDPSGAPAFWIKQKAFRLKEKIEVFRDATKADKRLVIQARAISDFSGGYDIIDPNDGTSVGGAKRHGFKSMFQDEWSLLDADGEVRGKCIERGGFLIVLRRWLPLIPQTFELSWDSQVVGHVKQRMHPFRLIYDVNFENVGTFDVRHGVGMVVLLLAIESGKDG